MLVEKNVPLQPYNSFHIVARAQALILGLGFRVSELDQPVNSFSGGWRMRLQLARALMCPSDLLLLDEPTNHLDAESVDWLEQFLKRFSGTVVAITHDRYFLDNAAEWILELDRGQGIPWKGNYSDWLDQKEKRLEVEQKKEDARIKAMKQELEWVRSNPKGRHAKSKARLARFEELDGYALDGRAREVLATLSITRVDGPHQPAPLTVDDMADAAKLLQVQAVLEQRTGVKSVPHGLPAHGVERRRLGRQGCHQAVDGELAGREAERLLARLHRHRRPAAL